jgi:hypothetical protein
MPFVHMYIYGDPCNKQNTSHFVSFALVSPLITTEHCKKLQQLAWNGGEEMILGLLRC